MKNLIKNKANKLKKLKAFTLIEMLIVIVIIGILAAALIPKLNSARGRANDTARKADISQAMAWLISVQIDEWRFPQVCGDLSLASGQLLKAWLNEIPMDPDMATVNNFSGADAWNMSEWEYGYCAISKNGQDWAWVVIAAIAETEWGANYVQCDGSELVNKTFSDIQWDKCTSFEVDSSCDASDCKYKEWEWQLRYIYIQ